MARARHATGVRRARALVADPDVPGRMWLSAEELPAMLLRRGAEGLVELEVGHGNGQYLLARAAAEPGVTFLGVEKDGHYFQQLRRLADEAGLRNLYSCWTDGVSLTAALPEKRLDAVHCYFPDPWPKKRHHRRRYFQRDVVAAVWRALKADGAFWAATDNLDYFEDLEALCLAGFEAQRFPGGWPEGAARTRYEARWMQAGRAIRRACFRPRAEVPPERWPEVMTSADEQIAKHRSRLARHDREP